MAELFDKVLIDALRVFVKSAGMKMQYRNRDGKQYVTLDWSEADLDRPPFNGRMDTRKAYAIIKNHCPNAVMTSYGIYSGGTFRINPESDRHV